MGPARRQLGRDLLVVPSDPGRRGRGMDSARHRRVADIGPARLVIQAGGAGQRRLGTGRVGVRRGLRRDLRARPDVPVRRPRCGGVLLRRRTSDRAAASALAGRTAGPADARRPRLDAGRDGSAASLAGPRLLARPGARAARHAGRHGHLDVGHAAAAFSVGAGQSLRVAGRGARLRRQPGRSDRARGYCRRVAQRQAAATGARAGAAARRVPGGLDPDRGLRVLRRPWHRPQQHDPGRAARRGRVSGSDPVPGSSAGDRACG